MNEYQVEIRVKNALILKKIKEKGSKSIAEFCRKNNVSQTYVNAIINFKLSPLDHLGKFRPFVVKFCDALDCLPEDIFTPTQMTLEMESNKRAIEVNETELQLQLDNLIPKLLEDQRAEDELCSKFMPELLKTLTPREEKVIRERFGLNEDGESKTLDEVGVKFGVNRGRIRQIEAKALRKLRHSSRCGPVREFIE